MPPDLLMKCPSVQVLVSQCPPTFSWNILVSQCPPTFSWNVPQPIRVQINKRVNSRRTCGDEYFIGQLSRETEEHKMISCQVQIHEWPPNQISLPVLQDTWGANTALGRNKIVRKHTVWRWSPSVQVTPNLLMKCPSVQILVSQCPTTFSEMS